MDGTCTVTTRGVVHAHTFAAGRLVRLLVRSSEGGRGTETVYAYDGQQLIRIETTRDDGVVARRELRYDASGHLEVVIEVSEGRERELRRFEYDTAGRLARLVRISDEGTPWRACTLSYDDLGRVTRYACGSLEVEDPHPDVTTYDYDAEGRLVAFRDGTWSVQTHYDAAGRRERIEVSAPEFSVQSTTTVVRDEQGRERELRSDMGELGSEVDVVVFDGTFGADAECHGSPPAPPGIPAHWTIDWNQSGELSNWH